MPWGLAFSVSRIIWKSDCGISFPSTIHEALKILWRQCSEFAWANIVSSTSVGLRRVALEVLQEVVGLVGSEGESHGLVGLGDRVEAPPEDVDLGERLRLEVVEELVGLVDRRHHCLGHPVVEEGQGGRDLGGLPVEVEGGPALDPPDHVEAALPRDVGGLRGPGRDGPEAGGHEDDLLAEVAGGGALGAVAQEPVQGLLLLDRGLPLDLDEVPELGGADAQPGADGPDRGVQLLEAEVREGGASGELQDGHGGFYIAGRGRPPQTTAHRPSTAACDGGPGSVGPAST